MHQIAEYGIAAHWNYKDGEMSPKSDQKFSWLRQFLDEDKQSVKPKEFLQNLKMELFTDEIFVFTPGGDVQFLVKGAVSIDFAYRIHSEVGHCYIGAKVNGYIVPINYELQSGDQVEILTSKKAAPKSDWLQWVKTRHARSTIRQFIKLQNRDELLQQGKEKLKDVCQFQSLPFQEIEAALSNDKVLDKFHIKSGDELLLMMAQGECSSKAVALFIAKDVLKLLVVLPQTKQKVSPMTTGVRKDAAIVLGERDIQTTLAKCCSPLPGDDITGIVVPSKGVSIHRVDCQLILAFSQDEKDRLIEVLWDSNQQGNKYTVVLIIEAFDRVGILQDILTIISDKELNMVDLHTSISSDKSRMKSKVILQVDHLHCINDLKKALLSHPDVICVGRPS